MSKRSFNDYTTEGNVTTVTLADHKGNKRDSFIIDTDSLPKIEHQRWYLSKKKYVRSRIGSLHRFLLNNPTGIVDHINHNGLDNRLENLRAVTNAQNTWNSTKPKSRNTTGFKGVCYDKRYNKYQAMICKDGHRKYLGLFKTPNEAHEVYKTKHKELFGEYSPY